MGWKAAPRPDWVLRINAEGDVLDRKQIVPLDERSLIESACQSEGLTDFGDDRWRKHFRVLLGSLESEAQLTMLGRILTRSDLLLYLRSRLQVTDWYKRHPEIEQEKIDKPVFIVGLGRSGTTILHEALAQDEQFRFVSKWESYFPCPPPLEETYETDPRVALAHELITLQDRIAPEWKSKHAVAGHYPVECVEFTPSCFLTELFTASFQIPTYDAYLEKADFTEYYEWHRKLLKLLQFRFKRNHWLLKGANHLPYVPTLLKIYPDARIIFPARDPIVAAASLVSVLGTIYSFRTDTPFSSNTYAKWMLMDRIADMLNNLVGWVEDGTLKPGQFSTLNYLEFSKDPVATIRKTYEELGLTLTPETAERIRTYLSEKPKAVFGKHAYDVGDAKAIATERKLLERYQRFFNVQSEV